MIIIAFLYFVQLVGSSSADDGCSSTYSLEVPGGPFVSLEHVNVNSGPWNDLLESFFFGILELSRDPRAEGVANDVRRAGGTTDGLEWGNIGLQQIHMPAESVQVFKGKIGLIYPDLLRIIGNMDHHNYTYTVGSVLVSKDGSKMTIDYIDTTAPGGSVMRLHQQQGNVTWFGPAEVLPPVEDLALPGGLTVGMGMRYLEYDVPQGTALGVCEFYKHYFDAWVSYRVNGESGSSKHISPSCLLNIGYHQYILFLEQDLVSPTQYDGHHAALYINNFVPIYHSLAADNLVYENPRFPQFSYKSVEEALHHNEYRIRDIVDIHTGKVLLQFEQEIRSLNHPSFCCPHLLPDIPDSCVNAAQ